MQKLLVDFMLINHLVYKTSENSETVYLSRTKGDISKCVVLLTQSRISDILVTTQYKSKISSKSSYKEAGNREFLAFLKLLQTNFPRTDLID